jgi:CBS domain-containing protein
MLIADLLHDKGGAVATTTPDETVREAVARMEDRGIGSLVVMGEEKVVGIITERDVLRALASRGCDAVQAPVADLMSKELLVAGPEDTTDYAMAIMTEHHIRHLPVMDGDRLLGILSLGDTVNACRSEAEFENRMLKRYIKAWPEEEAKPEGG